MQHMALAGSFFRKAKVGDVAARIRGVDHSAILIDDTISDADLGSLTTS